MNHNSPLAVVQAWQEAANDQQIDRLLALSAPNIELVGPRGSAHGHDPLRDWLARARLRLITLRTFTRDEVVVLAQHGTWQSPETDEVLGEATVATLFRIADDRVTQLTRFDDLQAAVTAANLTAADEVSPRVQP